MDILSFVLYKNKIEIELGADSGQHVTVSNCWTLEKAKLFLEHIYIFFFEIKAFFTDVDLHY